MACQSFSLCDGFWPWLVTLNFCSLLVYPPSVGPELILLSSPCLFYDPCCMENPCLHHVSIILFSLPRLTKVLKPSYLKCKAKMPSDRLPRQQGQKQPLLGRMLGILSPCMVYLITGDDKEYKGWNCVCKGSCNVDRELLIKRLLAITSWIVGRLVRPHTGDISVLGFAEIRALGDMAVMVATNEISNVRCFL